MGTVDLGPRALRDLRRMGPGPQRERVRLPLAELAKESVDLDVKALSGRSPWLRLRVGDYRMIYRSYGEPGGWWVERIVHRRELDDAVRGLRSPGG